MKKHVKLISVLIVLSLLGGCFTACGGGKEPVKAQDALSVNNVTGKAYGDIPFALMSSGGSGSGAVTFSLVSGTAATVTETGLVTILSPGSVKVKAVKAADTEYKAAESPELTIEIAKKPAAVPQPYYDRQILYPGDALPELHVSIPGGRAVFDAGQTVQEGTHSYTWTFTPDDPQNYAWTGLTGALEISAAAMPSGESMAEAIWLRQDVAIDIELAHWNDYRYYKFMPETTGYFKMAKTTEGITNAYVSLNDAAGNFVFDGNGPDSLINCLLYKWELYYFKFGTNAGNGESYGAVLGRFNPVPGEVPGMSLPLSADESTDISFVPGITTYAYYRYYHFVPAATDFYKITADSWEINAVRLTAEGNYIEEISGAGYIYRGYLTAGEKYYFGFWIYNNESRTFSVGVSSFAPAAGEMPETAILLALGQPLAITFPAGNIELYYKYVPDTSGSYTMTGSGQNIYFHTLDVYYEDNGYINGLNYDLTSTTTNFTGIMELEAGTTYYFLFSNNNGKTPTLDITFNKTPGP